MANLMLLSAIYFGGFSIVNGFGEPILGKGRWYVMNIMKCEDDSKMLYKLEVRRHKVNRTHDAFSGRIKFGDTLDESFAIHIDVCKYVDGGCKPYQVMADDSFQRFVKKYAGDNVNRLLGMAGVEPPDFPVPAGDYEVDSFSFDYDDLPAEGVYGKFDAAIYILKDGLRVSCFVVTACFTSNGNDDD